MGGFPARKSGKALMVLAGVVLCGAASAWGQTAGEQEAATPKLRAVRTIVPEDFQESQRDRLSGGLPENTPFRMVMDSMGRILVTDPSLGLVHVFDLEHGKRWQINGDRNQRMVYPTYIDVDEEDNIYISEPKLSAVLVFRPDGSYLRKIGEGRLFAPFGLAVDRQERKLYVVDHFRDEVQVYSLEGEFVQAVGRRGVEKGGLLHPTEVVLNHGAVFVLDMGNQRFEIFDLEGNAKDTWPFGRNRYPLTFAFDGAGNLYYVDMYSLGMLVVDPEGKRLAAMGVQVPYGQPSRGGATPSFVSVVETHDGSVLALRPPLTIDVIKLEPKGKE